MSISNEKKNELVKKFSQHEKDTGSSEVQIAILTERINNLANHFEDHKKDFHSRRGLLKMISRRKKLLAYLKRTKVEVYQKMLKELNLRR